MAGSVIDLNQPGVRLPELIGFDTNVLATRFIPPAHVSPSHAQRRSRVRSFLLEMQTARSTGLVPTTAAIEFVHLGIKARYTHDLVNNSHVIGGKKIWELLFKARPDLPTGYMRGYMRGLRRILSGLSMFGIVVLQPDDLGPLPGVSRFESALLGIVRDYHLNSSDAAVLLELKRAGIAAILTEDPDLRRAATDFDVYTWL